MGQLKDLIVNGNTRLIGDAVAQTPDMNSNNTEIATTEFVKIALNNINYYVKIDTSSLHGEHTVKVTCPAVNWEDEVIEYGESSYISTQTANIFAILSSFQWNAENAITGAQWSISGNVISIKITQAN